MRNQIAEPPPLGRAGLRKEIADLVLDPDLWLMTPHELLGGREPLDLLDSGDAADEKRLRDLIESIKHGLFS
jgi:hypothetical protein